jgi:predicted nucleotidyltransferase
MYHGARNVTQGKRGMTEKVRHILAELRREFEALYGARLARMVLYGSQARGDDDESDIDVLVVLKGPVNPYDEIRCTIDVTAALSLEHDVVISCLYMSDERFGHERSSLMLNVRREGIPI